MAETAELDRIRLDLVRKWLHQALDATRRAHRVCGSCRCPVDRCLLEEPWVLGRGPTLTGSTERVIRSNEERLVRLLLVLYDVHEDRRCTCHPDGCLLSSEWIPRRLRRPVPA